MSEPQRSCWYIGVTRMCECGGDQIPVATDGRSEWAHCHICKKTWDMKTLKEIKDERSEEHSHD